MLVNSDEDFNKKGGRKTGVVSKIAKIRKPIIPGKSLSDEKIRVSKEMTPLQRNIESLIYALKKFYEPKAAENKAEEVMQLNGLSHMSMKHLAITLRLLDICQIQQLDTLEIIKNENPNGFFKIPLISKFLDEQFDSKSNNGNNDEKTDKEKNIKEQSRTSHEIIILTYIFKYFTYYQSRSKLTSVFGNTYNVPQIDEENSYADSEDEYDDYE